MTKSRGIRVRRGTRAAWVAEQQGRHFCGCGCGEAIRLKPEHFNTGIPGYLAAHNLRVMPKQEPVPRKPCECGCGELAAPGKRFISGHNAWGRQMSAEGRQKLRESKLGERNPMFGKKAPNAKPKPAATPCACGCGINSTPGRRYISGHNNEGKTGAAASRYQGGRYKRVDGYVFVLAPDHPLANHHYVPEHRLVMEQHLRTADPGSPYLIQLGNQMYLRPEFIVHHMDEVKDNNVIGNLRPMTLAEHRQWHNEHPHT